MIQEFYEFDNHPFNDCTIRTTLAKILSNDALGRVWLIQHGSEAICYIILRFGYSLKYQGRNAFIDEFYIKANYRGQGVGISTIKFIESVGPSLGIHAVHLEVERQDTVAQNFYGKVGFKEQRYLMIKGIATAAAK